MKIGGKEYSEIVVTDADDNLLVSITDQNIIQGNNCKVVCVTPETHFTENPEQFIRNEAFRIYCESNNEEVRLEALKILAAQR